MHIIDKVLALHAWCHQVEWLSILVIELYFDLRAWILGKIESFHGGLLGLKLDVA